MTRSCQKIQWYPDEYVFIKKNFRILTAKQITEHINSLRKRKVQLHSVRMKMYDLGCRQSIPVEWTPEETSILLANYQTTGNLEIVKMLNSLPKPSRIFNAKVIWKKMKLLKIHRTKDELTLIRNGNKARHCYPGRVHFQPIGHKVIWKLTNGTKRWYIKNDKKKYVWYSVWLWESIHGPVPKGFIVTFKDRKPLNCVPENLELITKAEHSRRNNNSKLPPEFRKSISLINKINKLLREQKKSR